MYAIILKLKFQLNRTHSRLFFNYKDPTFYIKLHNIIHSDSPYTSIDMKHMDLDLLPKEELIKNFLVLSTYTTHNMIFNEMTTYYFPYWILTLFNNFHILNFNIVSTRAFHNSEFRFHFILFLHSQSILTKRPSTLMIIILSQNRTRVNF